VEVFRCLGHFVVRFDGRFVRTLRQPVVGKNNLLRQEVNCSATYKKLLCDSSKHLLITLWRLSILCCELDFESCLLKSRIWDSSFYDLLSVCKARSFQTRRTSGIMSIICHWDQHLSSRHALLLAGIVVIVW
jgi:hypothetical protein